MALQSLRCHAQPRSTSSSSPWRCSVPHQARRPTQLPTAVQRVRAVTGQVRETTVNDNGNVNGAAEKHGITHDQQAVEVPKRQFNWFKSWYPVAILEDLDPAVPMHTQLLGMDLAIWWDSNANQWRAFQDRCPHRLAPLSEGIIDAKTGELYCNYHGWTFNGKGRCTSVPQLPEGQPLSSSRSCVASYPTRSAEGLLWVWPDASPASLIESADEAAWPGLAPELDEFGDAAFSKAIGNHKWYARDMPYPWLAAKENAYNDVSHDQVLHHGVGSTDRAHAKPIPMKVTEITPVGYTVSEASGVFSDIIRFPSGARRQFPTGAGVAYVVPTGVGSCRHYHTGVQTAAGMAAAAPSSGSKSLQAVLSELQMWARSKRPKWMLHMFSHMVFDADIAIQARVDYNRAVSDHVYMPAAADAGPAAYMRWLKEYGGGGPPVAKLKDPFVGTTPPGPLPRQQLLDRFNQHTKHCKACRTAYQQATAAHRITGVLALLAGSAALAMLALAAAGAVLVTPAASTAAAAVSGQVGGWGPGAVMAAVAALLGAAYVGLGRLLRSFVFIDYDSHHVGKRS